MSALVHIITHYVLPVRLHAIKLRNRIKILSTY